MTNSQTNDLDGSGQLVREENSAALETRPSFLAEGPAVEVWFCEQDSVRCNPRVPLYPESCPAVANRGDGCTIIAVLEVKKQIPFYNVHTDS